MKKLFFVLFLLSNSYVWLLAQPTVFFLGTATGTTVKVGLHDTLTIRGSLINHSAGGPVTIHNAGHIYLTGDLKDAGKGLFQSSSFSDDDSFSEGSVKGTLGHIYFVGDTLQTIESKQENAIWLGNVHLNNKVKLGNSIRLLGVLHLHDSLDLNGQHLYHYIYNSFDSVGNWGKWANETNSAFVYDSRLDSAGAVWMLKSNAGELKDLKTMGLTVAATNNTAKILVSRHHKSDSGVTSGITIRKYFDVEKSSNLNITDPVGIRYFNHDVDFSEMSEADFSLFELRRDGLPPKARRLQSDSNSADQYIHSSDSINYAHNKRYSVASTRCSNPPFIDLGADTSLCTGSTLLLNAPVYAYAPLQYEWKRGTELIKKKDNDSTLVVREGGTYYLRVIDSRGCESIDSIKIVPAENPQPRILASHFRRCESNPFTFTDVDTSGVNIALRLWHFGDGTSATDSVCIKSYDPLCAAYTVYLTTASDKGCRAQDSVRVAVEQRKQPQIRKTVNDRTGSFTAIDTLLGCSNDITIATWYINGDSVSTGSQLNNYVFPSYGEYVIGLRLQGTLCDACTEEKIVVNAPGVPRFILTAGKKDYCTGESIALLNTSEVNSGSFTSYWNFGNGQLSQNTAPPAISYAAAGSYVISLTMESRSIPGWQRIYKDTVHIHALPSINFGNAIYHCKAQYTLQPQEAENNRYLYEWKRGEVPVGSGYTYTANTDGTYTLTVTDNQYGCRNSEQTVLILNNRLQPLLGDSREGCGSITLDAHNPGAAYLWNTGATTREITATQSGTYHVQVRDAEGCEGRDTVAVIIYEVPHASLGADVFLCDNETLTLQPPINATGAAYRWNTGAVSESITVASAGIYSIRVTPANGKCPATDTVQVFQRQAPVVTFDGAYYVCNAQSITLSQHEHSAADLIRWTYPNGETAEGLQINTGQSGRHTVYVRYPNGCHATGSVTVGQGATNAVANFMLSSIVNTNDILQMVNLSYPDPLTYRWEVENTLFSTEEDPQLTLYAGAHWMAKDTFYVRLTVSNGACPVSKTKRVIVLRDGFVNVKNEATGEEVIIGPNENGEQDATFSTQYLDMLDATLYPNPVRTGYFTVNVKLTAQVPVQVVVFNLSGKIMDKKLIDTQAVSEQIQIDTADYPSGIYLVHVSAGRQTRLLKVIVE